jgi:hypothetical protein
LSFDDKPPVALDNVKCIARGPKAWQFKFTKSAIGAFEAWIPSSLITPGVFWRPGLTSALTIPEWLWRKKQGEQLRKRKTPQPEFETDRFYQRITVLCETRGNNLKVENLFDDLIVPMYLAMRQELLEAQHRVRLAHEELLGLAAAMAAARTNSAPPNMEDAVLAIADGLVKPLPPPPEYIPTKPQFHECADGIFLSEEWAAGFCACGKRIPDHAGYKAGYVSSYSMDEALDDDKVDDAWR